MAKGALSRRTSRTQLARRARPLRKRTRLELLEDRRLLAFTVNHTPYLQLGDAALTGYDGGADQAEVLWQTTGTQDTDTFSAEVRETGLLPWTNVTLNADINTGVNDGPGVRINHSATFAGLNFNDDYDYQITHLRGGSPIATYSSTFHTRLNPSDSSNFTFVTYGDSASGDPPTNFIAVQNRINIIDPAFSLLLGDNVYTTGTHAEYDLRLDPSKNAALTTYNKDHIDYFGFGNHDVGYLSGQAARENYSMPIPVQGVTSPVPLVFDANVQAEENYSYDYGGAHFLTFDTNNWQNTAALNKQLDWAVADINAAKARATPPNWIIVFGHHPITSLGGHTEHTPDDYYYDQVVSRLGTAGVGVDLLLFGHAHNYQRSYPLTGHTGATATYVLDTDNNYAKGAGLPLVVQGVGGVGLGYGATDATFAGSYLAKALDSNTTVAAQYGFGKVDVTPTTLTYSYVNTLGAVLDSFTIGPPPPDTTPPTASLSVPLDNGPTDQNPAANQVTVATAQANLQIQLTDSGAGVDDVTVLSAAVSVTKDLVPLVAVTDYTFAYNSGTNVITLTPVVGSFGDGSYAVSLSSAIEDLVNNPLAPTVLSVSVNTALPTVVSFQDGVSGYAGAKDTYVHEDATSTNQGANVKVASDGDDDLGTAETNAQVVNGLIRFDNLFLTGGGASRIGGPIPDGATIVNATLTVRTGTGTGDISAATFELHRMIATWDESSTWTSLTSGISYNNTEAATASTAIASGGNVNVAGGLVTFNVTADVQLWSNDNSLSLRGWAIKPGSDSGAPPVSGQTDGWYIDSSETATLSNRPLLTVTYVLPPANVSAGGPYTINEGGSLPLSGSATGTGSLTYSWDVNGDAVFGDAVGATPTLNWAQLVGLGINDGLTTRNVMVRVADGYGHQVDSPAVLLTVNNVLPTSNAGGPYTIDEGQDLLLSGSGSDPVDALTYSWDVNGDSVFGDATGAAPTLSWAQLVSLGITDGLTTRNVTLRVDDGDSGVVDSTSVLLTVNNVNPTAANAGGPYTIDEGQGLSLSGSGSDPVDMLTYSWDVNGDNVFGDATGAAPTLSWAQLVSLGITDGLTTRNVALRVDDEDGGVLDSTSVLLTVNNVNPTAANAGGPYTIEEGQDLLLSGSGSDPVDTLTYSWDVNGDSVFGDATGPSPTLSWLDLVALGISDGTGATYNVKLQVSDGDGGITESSAVLLTVNNAAPSAAITGPASVTRGASANYTLTATDPADDDEAAGFTWSIDWNGDGSDVQVVNGLSGLVVAHTFSTVGARTIKVTATDDDGGVSSQSTHAVSVSAVQMVNNGGLFDLVWTGTAGGDSVSFEDLGGGDIRVTTTLDGGLATNFVETITGVTGIVNASGLAGDDTLDAALLSTTSARLDGGTGNNTLYGGVANDVLIGGGNVGPQVNGPEGQQGSNVIVGGDGDDTIYGNAVNGAEGKGGNNILLGGAGNDTIYGNWTDGGEGGGRNILVGGADADTLYDYKIADGAEGKGSILISGETSLGVPELSQIMLEWASTHTYNDRVNNILGPGSVGRLNGSAYLQPGSNVTSDAAVDQLWGSTGGTAFNWFLYTLAVDEINRAKVGETQTTL